MIYNAIILLKYIYWALYWQTQENILERKYCLGINIKFDFFYYISTSAPKKTYKKNH